MTFESLNLIPPLLRAVREKGYTEPTPIQLQAIPPGLEGRDVLGCAQTGTGKTAAFALPILQRLWKRAPATAPRSSRPILALVLCPTRELATQVAESFTTYGKHGGLKTAVVFGGVGYGKQRDDLKRGVDIVVATPGRLLDLIREKSASFQSLEVLVLDEADRMLDMGFLPDVKRVLAVLPKKRQTLFFSATMPKEIQALVDSLLHSPAKVAVAPVSTTAEKVEQSVYHVDKKAKPALLAKLLTDPEVERALVFTRTKRGADRVARDLVDHGIPAQAIHGNKSQNARERALDSFKTGRGRVLVATDIAARGIDVRGITHVVNYELPNVPETYVHRIGRTARASASGVAWALCSADEREYLRDIERLIRQKIPVAAGNVDAGEPRRAREEQVRREHGGRRGGGGSGREHGGRREHAAASHGGRGPRATHGHGAMRRPAPVAASQHAAEHRPAATTSFGAGLGDAHATARAHAGDERHMTHERTAQRTGGHATRATHGAAHGRGSHAPAPREHSSTTRREHAPHGSRAPYGAHVPHGSHARPHGARPMQSSRPGPGPRPGHAPRSGGNERGGAHGPRRGPSDHGGPRRRR